jgi:hypothetical protein
MTIHSWIHHDSQPDSKTISSTKSQVFRHVAAHRKLKRQQRTLKLRASALNVLRTLQVPSKDLPVVDRSVTSSPDPFHCLPIPLTSEICDLLQFDQAHLTPAFKTSKIRLHPSSRFLQDDLAVYGYLARIAVIKSRCCEDNTDALNLMLKMKAEAMHQLRVRLPHTPPGRLPLAVMALLFTETWCRNTNAAMIHMRLLEDINNQHGLSIEDLICVLHSDLQRSAMTLETTMFVLQDRGWRSHEADFSSRTVNTEDILGHFGDEIRDILEQMSQALAALDLLQTSDASYSHRQSATVKCLHVMSILLDKYNASSDVVEKCTALAALYRLRQEANMERMSLHTVTIFDAGRTIIPTMRELMTIVLDEPKDLYLWILSIGMSSGDRWFREEFVRQASALNLQTAADTERVLSRFEVRRPDGSTD